LNHSFNQFVHKHWFTQEK